MKKFFILIFAVVMGLATMAQGSNDSRRMGFFFGFNWNGSLQETPKKDSKFGSFTIGEVGFDCRMFTHESGVSHYLMLNGGADRTVGKRMKKADFNTYPLINGSDGTFLFKDYITYYSGELGYMLGIPMGKIGEIQPFVRFGYEFYKAEVELTARDMEKMAQVEDFKINDEITDDNATHNHAYYVEPGLRVTFNVLYPLQLYAQAVYSSVIKATDTYTIVNQYTKNFGYGHTKGWGIGGGVRVCF